MIKLKGCQNANKTEANMEIIRLEHVTKSYVIYEKSRVCSASSRVL